MAGRLPTGTVTLLCTDIEGSTSIVGRLGGRYVGVLEEHRRLVRDAVEAAGGLEIDCRGDEMLLVFTDAGAAVRGAVEAQRALASHAWPEGNEVRVRMGLHTGEPSVGGSTYVGLDVHRVARISDAGHGGQVLLSERTYELAGGEAVDLGPQPFKGLPEPERIYQVVADGLRQDFPPLRLGPEAAGNARAGVEPRRHAGGRRRGLRVAPRGDRAAARGRRARGRRAGRQRRRADAEGALVQAERGDRRHQDAADADGRGPARGEGDPRPAPRDQRARPLPV